MQSQRRAVPWVCKAMPKRIAVRKGRRSALASPATLVSLFWNHLGLRHVLVGDVHLDRARRRVGEILVAMDSAARNVDPVADLEHARRLALDGVGDLAL